MKNSSLLTVLIFSLIVISGYFFVRHNSLLNRSANGPLKDNQNTKRSVVELTDFPEASTGKQSIVENHSQQLDLAEEEFYLVTLEFMLGNKLNSGQRVNLLQKFNMQTWPYAGWAIGIKQYDKWMRPQIYWRDENEVGGWYAFAEFDIKEGVVYQLNVVIAPRQYATMFIKPLVPAQPSEAVVFLGGQDIASISIPNTSQALQAGMGKGKDGEANIVVNKLSMFKSTQLAVSKDKLMRLFSSEDFLKDLKNNGAISLVER
ncbi:MAG: hypothetical protein IT292_07830 [Deltaproteobacteria bacterium]|nr:hypothetical protein [Deltaproteobacteria bacterium]